MATNARIQLRRATRAQLVSANPILAAGEAAMETDTSIVRFGDGVTAFASLPEHVPVPNPKDQQGKVIRAKLDNSGYELVTLPSILPRIFPPGMRWDLHAASVPTGFPLLLANGGLVSRTTYADLFAVIGTTYGEGDGSTTFALPDWRGTFTRGLDLGRGLDPDRVLGSYQADDIKAHTHSFDADTGEADDHTHEVMQSQASAEPGQTTRVGSVGTGNVSETETGATEPGGAHSHTLPDTASTGGTETRVKNVALLACITY